MIQSDNKRLRFDLSLLSKYRSELMGVSMLFVLVCHARMRGASFPEFLLSLFALGDRGVDMFFLLSGIGIYFSLFSFYKGTNSILYWYKKRIFRVFLPFLIIEGPFYIWYCVINHLGIIDFFSYITLLSFWTDHFGPWFIAFLIPLYIISPLYYKVISRSRIFGFLMCLLLVFASLALSIIPFRNYCIDCHVIDNIQFCIQRAPGFIIGMWVAYYVKAGVSISYLWFLTLPIVYLLFPLCHFTGLMFRGWIVGSIFLILLTLTFSLISRMFEGDSKVMKILAIIGTSTLEIYLFNDIAVNLLEGHVFGTTFFILSIIIALVFGISFHTFYDYIRTKHLSQL